MTTYIITIIIPIIIIAATAVPVAAPVPVPIIGVAPVTTGAGVIAVVAVWRFLNNWSKAPRRKISKINGNNPGKKGIYEKMVLMTKMVFRKKMYLWTKMVFMKKNIYGKKMVFIKKQNGIDEKNGIDGKIWYLSNKGI